MWGALIACLAVDLAVAQTQTNVIPHSRVRKPKPPETQQAGERGPHWMTVTNLVAVPDDADGWNYQTNTYVHLEPGLNYRNAQGQWIAAKEEFELLPQGAVARQGQHQVTLPANLNGNQPVQLVQPDGQVVTSRPHGLAYYDTATGEAVLLAEIKDCQGFQTAPNQILYTDAFDDLQADVRYTYTRGGFEQDIVLKQAPPAPEKYGLNSATTRLEVWSEFLTAPEPGRQVHVLKPGPMNSGRDESFTDDQLDFGGMRMGAGRAFQAGAQDESSVPVGKSWIRDQGRNFLIEAVELPSVQLDLQVLPQTPGGAVLKHKPGKRETALRQLPMPAKAVKREQAAIRPATKELLQALIGPALVLDYSTLNSGTLSASYVFKGDTTYFINGQVSTVTSTTAATTFEGGAVFKYTNGVSAKLTVNTPISWQASLYRPIVFTSWKDNSVGEPISGSTGSPTTGDHTALYLDGSAAAASFKLAHLRIAYAQTAITINQQNAHNIRHLQLLNCTTGINSLSAGVYVGNALFSGVTTCFTGTTPTASTVEHATVDSATTFSGSGFTSANLTARNSLLYAVTTAGSYFNGGNNQSTAVNPFQTVKGGFHYLLSGSAYRNAGTTSIDTTLASELKSLTTFPPLVMTNIITANTALSPQALRDTDTPDLGFHYAPLDFVWSNLTINSSKKLILTNGVAVGLFGTVGLTANGTFISTGKADALNRLTMLSTVQENLQGIITNTASFSLRNASGANQPTTFAFTDISFLASSTSGREFSFYSNPIGHVTLTDCQLRGISLTSLGDFYLHTFTLKNCLSERSYFTLRQGTSSANPTNLAITLQNVLFSRCVVSLTHAGTTFGAWNVYDNLFDNSTVSLTEIGSYPTGSALTTVGYNGFIGTGTDPFGSIASDKVSLARDFANSPLTLPSLSGPVRDYYYPITGSAPSLATLGNADATSTRTPALLGLYNHTTRFDLAKEAATSTDIGYHYVATDIYGKPLDSDGDGLADYSEDINGNGAVDTGETSPLLADTDGDGFDDGYEVLAGSSPLDGTSPNGQLLANWNFNGATYPSVQGDQAIAGYKAQQNPKTWDGTAAELDYPFPGGGSGWLGYAWKDAKGRKLLNPLRGTVQFWFRPNWTSKPPGIYTALPDGLTTPRKLVTVQAPNDTTEYWALELNSSGNVITLNTLLAGGTVRQIITTPISFTANEWSLVTVTYDQTGASVWKNDVQLATGAVGMLGWPAAVPGASAKNLWIGGWSYSTAPSPANAQFENLSCFNKKLTSGEIQSTYRQVASLDTDGDGLTDLLEISLSSFGYATITGDFSSLSRDTDADGLPDAWEYKYFGNNSNGASGNTDGDSLTNLQEYVAGTNPTVNDSDLGPAGQPAWQLVPYDATLINIDFAQASRLEAAPTDHPDYAGMTAFSSTSINPVMATAYPTSDQWNTVGPGFATIRVGKADGNYDYKAFYLQNMYGPMSRQDPEYGCVYALDSVSHLPIRPTYSKPPGYKTSSSANAPGGTSAGSEAPLPPTCTVTAVPIPTGPPSPWSPASPGFSSLSVNYILITNCTPTAVSSPGGAVGIVMPEPPTPYVPPVNPPPEGTDPCTGITGYSTTTQYPPAFRFPYTFTSSVASVAQHPMYRDFLATEEEIVNEEFRSSNGGGWYPYDSVTRLRFAEMKPGSWRVVVYAGTENAARQCSIQIGDVSHNIDPGNPFENRFIEGRHYVQGMVTVGDDGEFFVTFPKPAVVNGIQLLLLTQLDAPNWSSSPASAASDTVGSILRWDQVPGALTYSVLRATVSGGPYVELISGLNATRYVDSAVQASTTYYYKVVANNEVPEFSSTSIENPIAIGPGFVIRNRAPVLSYVNPMGPAWSGRGYAVGLDELRRKALATDFDGDALSFRIEELRSGTLTINGLAVTDANLKAQLTASGYPLYSLRSGGPSVVWQPADNQNGVVSAFVVRAFDGTSYSEQTAVVPVEVKPPVEVEWWGSTFLNLTGNGRRVDRASEMQKDIELRYTWPGQARFWGVFPAPVLLPDGVQHLQDVVELAAGSRFTLALKSDGTLWSWGDGAASLGDGQVVHGGDSTYPLPWFQVVPAVNPLQITAVAPGGSGLPLIRHVSTASQHSVAVSTDGHVYVWGTRTSYDHGWNSTFYGENLCEEKLALPAIEATTVSYDKNDYSEVQLAQACAVHGTSTPTLITELDRVTMAACSESGAVVLKENGEIYDWGTVIFMDYTSAGFRSDYNSSTIIGPTPVFSSPHPVRRNLPAGQVPTEVVAGGSVYLALTASGQVYAWGANDSGAFADSTWPFLPTAANCGTDIPRRVPGLPSNVIHLAASGRHFMALTATGTVYEWGYLYDSTISKPRVVHNLPAADRIYTTGDRAFAVDRDGRLWAWGFNGSNVGGGRYYDLAGLLIPDDHREFIADPVMLPDLTNVEAVSSPDMRVMHASSEQLPPNPRNLTARGADGSVTLSWSAYPAATEYRIYQSDTAGGTPLLKASVPAENTATQTWVDSRVSNNLNYYYRVSAVLGSVETGLSQYAWARPEGVPAALTGLNCVLLSRELRVRWCPADRARRYNIERAGPYVSNPVSAPDSDFKYLYQIEVNQLPAESDQNGGCYKKFINDTDLQPGKYYRYRVAAENAAGIGPSSVVTAQVPASATGPAAPSLTDISVWTGVLPFTDNNGGAARTNPGWIIRIYQYVPALTAGGCDGSYSPTTQPLETDPYWSLIKYLPVDDLTGGNGTEWAFVVDAANPTKRSLHLYQLTNGSWYKVVVSSRDSRGANSGADGVSIFRPLNTDGKITMLESRSGPGYIYLRYKSQDDSFITKIKNVNLNFCNQTVSTDTSKCYFFTEWPWNDGSDTETWILNLPAPTTGSRNYTVRTEPGGSVDDALSYEHTFNVTYRDPASTPLTVVPRKGDGQLRLQWDDYGTYAGWKFMVERISAPLTPTPAACLDLDRATPWKFLKEGQERVLVDKGLDNNLQYKYRVIAINPDDLTAAGFVWEVTPWLQPGLAISDPNSLNFTATAKNSAVEVAWTAPGTLLNGAVISKYELHHQESTSWSEEVLYEAVPGVDPFTYVHQPLINGSTHKYWLVVRFDNEDDVTLPVLTRSPLSSLAPANPANLTVVQIPVGGNMNIRINWDPVPGARAYLVYSQVSGGSCVSQMTARTYFEATVPNTAIPSYYVTAIGTGGIESNPTPCASLVAPVTASSPSSLLAQRGALEVQNVVLMLPGSLGTPATVITPTNVTLRASIAISAATIQKVQYYANDSVIGELVGKPGETLAPPYAFDWVNPPASPSGGHVLKVVVVTDHGPQTSATVNLVVTVRPPLSEFVTAETDLVLKGPSGGSFAISREYHSSDGSAGILGTGWKFNFERAQIKGSSAADGSDLSAGWELVGPSRDGGLLGFLHPVVQETSSAKHEIKVVLPSGDTLRFAPVVELAASSQSFDQLLQLSDLNLDQDTVITAGTVSYYPVDGSGAQLDVLVPDPVAGVKICTGSVSQSDVREANGTHHLPVALQIDGGIPYQPTQFRLTLTDGSQLEYVLPSGSTDNVLRLSRMYDVDRNSFDFETWVTTGSTLSKGNTSFANANRIRIVANSARWVNVSTGLTTIPVREAWLDLVASTKTCTIYDAVVTADASSSVSSPTVSKPGVKRLVSGAVSDSGTTATCLQQAQQLKDRAGGTGAGNYRTQTYGYHSYPNPPVSGFTSQLVLDQVVSPDGVVMLKNTYDVSNGLLVLKSQTDSVGAHRDMAYPSTQGGNLTSTVTTSAGSLPAETVAYSDRGEITQVTDTAGVTTQNAYDDRGRLAFSGTGPANAMVNISAYSYDGKDRPTDVTDGNGATTHYEYTDDSRPAIVTDANQNSTQYLYNRDSPYGTQIKLRTQVDAANNFTDYDYNDRGQVTKETRHLAETGESVSTRYEYYEANTSTGSVGDLKRVYQPLATICAGQALAAFPALLPAYATEYTYDAAGNRLTEAVVRTTRVVVSGAEVTKLERITTTCTPDPLGRSVATARQRDWVYDNGAGAYAVESGSTLALESSSTAFNNAGRQASSVDPYNRTSSFLYDVRGNLIQTSYPDGTVTRTVYDTLGRAIATQERARPSTPASGGVPALGTTTAPTTQTDYDSAGRVVNTHRFSGTVITITADTGYQGYVGTNPAQYTAALTTAGTEWSKTRSVYDATTGRLQYQVSPLGTLTESIYNTIGQRIESRVYYDYSFPLDSTAISTAGKSYYRTTYQYDSVGNNTVVWDAKANLAAGNPAWPSTPPLTAGTQFTYDTLNRNVQTTFPVVNSVRANRVTVYDSLGRRVQEVDEEQVTTVFRYDLQGRMTAVINNWQAGLADSAQLFRTRYEYDEVGSQIAQVDAASTQTSGVENRRTRYEYDALGRRVARVLPGGTLAAAEQTTYNRTASTAYPGTFFLSRVVKDFQGNTVTYDSDIADRPQYLTLPDGLGVTKQIRWEYNDQGRVLRVRDFNNTTSALLREQRYGYDVTGRLRIKAVPEGTLTMNYDAAGNQTLLTAQTSYSLPTGTSDTFTYEQVSGSAITPANSDRAKMAYLYDPMGRLSAVNADNSTPTITQADATYSYDANGNLATLGYRNSLLTTYTYNARNQLRSVRSTVGGALRGTFDYDGADTATHGVAFASGRGLSAVGLRRQLAEWVGNGGSGTVTGARIQYDYDGLHRLTSENRGTQAPQTRYDFWVNGSTTYAGYDRVGNRQTRTTQTGSTVTATRTLAYNALDQITSAGFSFDANGNMLKADLDGNGTADNSTPDVYDGLNRLVQAVRGTKTVTLAYDADGNRVSKSVLSGGVTTTTLYLVADRNPTGYAQVIEERPTASGSPTIRYVYGFGLVQQYQVTGLVTRYFGRDGLGSVRYLTDGSGSVTDTYYYDAFGLPASGGTGTTVNSYRFAGEQWDADLGLYYNRARYYSPELGRFWSMDSFEGNASDPLSLHKYLYCQANPFNRVDPSGQFDIVSFTVSNAIRGGIAGLTFGTISGAYAYAKGATAKAAFTQAFKVAALTEFAFISPLAAVAFTGGGIVTLGLGIYNGDVTANDIPEIATCIIAAAVLHTTMNPSMAAAEALEGAGTAPSGAVLEGANFAQKWYRPAFSTAGKKFYTFVAGKPIKTIDDLVAAIKDGTIAVRDIPVDYVVRNGKTLILNTRTAAALERAGIPRSEWNAVDQTGSSLFEQLVSDQLQRNELGYEGTPTVTQE